MTGAGDNGAREADQPKPAAAGEEGGGQSADGLYLLADSLQAEAVEREEEERPETWVAFTAGGRGFALPVSHVQEILRVGEITPIPSAPVAVLGAANLRGRVLPVVDLRLRLGLAAPATDERTRVLVLDSRDRLIGLLVDSVEEVVQLLPSRMETTDAGDGDDPVTSRYELEDRGLALLDPERLLRLPQGTDHGGVDNGSR